MKKRKVSSFVQLVALLILATLIASGLISRSSYAFISPAAVTVTVTVTPQVWIPLIAKEYTPVPMTFVYYNTKSMYTSPVCYEIHGSGIGQQCEPVADEWRLYGTFPAGTYRVVYDSAACVLKDYNRVFEEGAVYHNLYCSVFFP